MTVSWISTMAAEIQNSNPTILNVADLPTRQRPAPSRKPGVYDSGIFASPFSSLTHFSDPIAVGPYSSAESDSDGDLMEEPIDEQEIYGMIEPIGFEGRSGCFYMSLPPVLVLATGTDGLRPCIYDFGSRTSNIPWITCCCLPSGHLNQTLSSKRPQFTSSNRYSSHHAHNHAL